MSLSTYKAAKHREMGKGSRQEPGAEVRGGHRSLNPSLLQWQRREGNLNRGRRIMKEVEGQVENEQREYTSNWHHGMQG